MKLEFNSSVLGCFSNNELLSSMKKAVESEKAAITNVVRHFNEIFRRRLFASLGYSSMFLFAVEELGYDNASAQRRVNAMELSLAVPEVLEFIEEKRMFLQSAADIQKFLNKERGDRKPYSTEEKTALVQKCLCLSTREVQRHLASLDPEVDFTQSKRFVSADRLQVTHTVSIRIEEKLDRIKGLLAHVNPYMNREELLDRIAEIALDKLDPLRKAQRIEKRKAKFEKSSTVHDMPASKDSVEECLEKIVVEEKCAHEILVPAQEVLPPLQLADEIVGEFGEVQMVVMFEVPRLRPRTGINKIERRQATTVHSARVGYERGTPSKSRPYFRSDRIAAVRTGIRP